MKNVLLHLPSKSTPILLLFFLGCCNNEVNPSTIQVDQLVFGETYPLPIPGTNNLHTKIYRLSKDSLYLDTLNTYPITLSAPYTGSFIPLNEDLYNKVKHLLLEIPFNLTKEPSGTMGGGSCAPESGYYYVSFEVSGQVKYWLMGCEIKDEYRAFTNSLGIELGWLRPS